MDGFVDKEIKIALTDSREMNIEALCKKGFGIHGKLSRSFGDDLKMSDDHDELAITHIASGCTINGGIYLTMDQSKKCVDELVYHGVDSLIESLKLANLECVNVFVNCVVLEAQIS